MLGIHRAGLNMVSMCGKRHKYQDSCSCLNEYAHPRITSAPVFVWWGGFKWGNRWRFCLDDKFKGNDLHTDPDNDQVAGGRTGEQELHRGEDRCRGTEQVRTAVSSTPSGRYYPCVISLTIRSWSPVGLLTDI